MADREVLKKWQEHPLREILRRASQGDRIYPDTLDRLGLPPVVRKAAEQAIGRVKPGPDGKRVARYGPLSPDAMSMQLVEGLYRVDAAYETPSQRRERQAAEGDPTALAELQAAEQGTKRIVDRIWEKTHG